MKKLAYLILTLLVSSYLMSQNVPIDFEPGGIGAGFTWTVFENDTNPPLEFVPNPDVTGINNSSTVAKFTALQAGAPFAGCETMHGADIGTFNITSSNALISIMVYKSVISDVGIKLVTASNAALPEIKIPNTLINEWEVITFDFSSHIGGMTYDQIVIFPDFQARATDNVVYFDNIYDSTTAVIFENDVTYQVDMNEEIYNGNFDPATQYVFVTGGNAHSPLPYFYCGDPMTDDNNDGIYEITRTYNSNLNIFYKFYIGEIADIGSNNCDGITGLGYEPFLPADCGVGNYFDREHFVNGMDAVLPPVCFGACEVCNPVACIEVLNISGSIATGTYQADDVIVCSGIINSTSGGPVDLRAGANSGGAEYILLNNGFEAIGDVNFSAVNEQCNFFD